MGKSKSCGSSEEAQVILLGRFKEGSMEEATLVQFLGKGGQETEKEDRTIPRPRKGNRTRFHGYKKM